MSPIPEGDFLVTIGSYYGCVSNSFHEEQKIVLPHARASALEKESNITISSLFFDYGRFA